MPVVSRSDYKVTKTATLKVGVPGTGTGGTLTVPTVLSTVYALRTFNVQGNEQTLEFPTQDHEYTDELVNNRRWTISCSAFDINGSNPGLALIRTALKGTASNAVLYFEYETDTDDGHKGFGTLKGESIPYEADQPIAPSWSFGVVGKLYDIDETI